MVLYVGVDVEVITLPELAVVLERGSEQFKLTSSVNEEVVDSTRQKCLGREKSESRNGERSSTLSHNTISLVLALWTMMEGSYVLQQQRGKAPIQVATPQMTVPMMPDPFYRRTFLHKASLVLNLATIGSAANMTVGQVWGMIVVQNIPFVEIIVRAFSMGFSVLVIFNEMGWTSPIRESPILSSFLWRGVLYTFLGSLGVMMNDIGSDNIYYGGSSQYNNYSYGSNKVTFYMPTYEQASEVYLAIMCWSMFGIGMIYILLGVLRIQRIVDRHKEEYRMHTAGVHGAEGSKSVLCGTMV